MQGKQENKEENIDIKALFLKYAQYWYYFILSILFFGFIAFLNNRYTVPEYSVSTTLLIRDDKNSQLGAENLLEGLELFSGKKNLNNEIVILNSYSLSEQIVEELKLGVSYFQHGFLITNELFNNSPFKVNIDSNHLQLTGIDFQINPLDSLEFTLVASTKDKYPYNISTEKLDKSLSADFEIERNYSFDSIIESDFFSFSIIKTDYFDLKKILENGNHFSFKLHQTDKLCHKLIDAVNINPINKEASILILNIKGRTPKKNIKILNTLTKIYIRS